jgi:hypothetical protein
LAHQPAPAARASLPEQRNAGEQVEDGGAQPKGSDRIAERAARDAAGTTRR